VTENAKGFIKNGICGIIVLVLIVVFSAPALRIVTKRGSLSRCRLNAGVSYPRCSRNGFNTAANKSDASGGSVFRKLID
jgi:hypothetical protein